MKIKLLTACVILLCLLSVLSGCSSDTDSDFDFLQDHTVFRYKQENMQPYAVPEGMVLNENPMPDYIYTVTLLDSDRIPLTDEHPLACGKKSGTVRYSKFGR